MLAAVRFTVPPVTVNVWLAVASWNRSMGVAVNEPLSTRKLKEPPLVVKLTAPFFTLRFMPATLPPKPRLELAAPSTTKVAPDTPVSVVKLLFDPAGRFVELRAKTLVALLIWSVPAVAVSTPPIGEWASLRFERSVPPVRVNGPATEPLVAPVVTPRWSVPAERDVAPR